MRSRLCVALFIVCLCPWPASAQDGDEAAARRQFEIGAALYQEENYEGALVAFEESYALRGVPVVLFNIAQTFRRLYRYDEAIDSYEQYLRTGGLSGDRRAGVRATIAELRRATAPVTIETDVEGVGIYVDDRHVGDSPLPGPVTLAAGNRIVEARRDGYVTVREELRVVGGEPTQLELRMAEADTAGVLRVRSNVPAATVRIDGVEVGTAPVERRLGEGGHSVEVEAAGYETYRNEVVLASRQERDLFAELDPEGMLWERWWFWASVAGAALVLTTIIIVAATAGGQADPIPGTLGTVDALRW